MEDGRYRIVFDSAEVDSADSLEDVVSSITSAIKDGTSSAAEQGFPLLPNEFYDKITNRFIIIDKETDEEYDGSGYPIRGKYVLNRGSITKKLNARNLMDANRYLYDVASKEYDWMCMISDDISFRDVLNKYTITNTKTSVTYD